MSKLKPRERDAIVQALRAGVVPKLGLRHIQVGRVREIEELVKDMDRISDDDLANLTSKTGALVYPLRLILCLYEPLGRT
jgi:hypothetical protein